MQLTSDYPTTVPPRGVEVLIMDAQSVDETKSTVVCPSSGIKNHTISIIVNASVAGTELTGNVQLETNSDPNALGGWSPLGGGTIDLSTIDVPAATVRGILQLMFSNITFTAIRARIETVVAGGTVSVTYLGN